MKRPLFVFAGQSNMMGAAVFPPKEQVTFVRSFEYLHKPRRFGLAHGEFKSYGFPSGEFSYKDMKQAYGDAADPTAKSELADYGKNAYFCPSIADLTEDEPKVAGPFNVYSEAHTQPGPCLPPYLIELLEKEGLACAYAHIAKGGVPISHYLSGGSADYFAEKVRDFFTDAEENFAEDDTSLRVLFWHQGESDGECTEEYYLSCLTALREKAHALGFTHICILRVGIWGDPRIASVMRAQEEFCRIYPDCHMLTRVASYFPWAGIENSTWLAEPVAEECQNCRDSFFGFWNQHINEKGFRTVAAHAAPNLIRILRGEEPILEEERVLSLLDENIK